MSMTNFYRAISIMFKDKIIFLLGSVPILIGMILYFFLGVQLYQLVMVQGQEKIQSLLGDSSGASFAYGVLFVLFMAILFFIVNWTFVMIVSILSSPFNDAISTMVEKKYSALKVEQGEGKKVLPPTGLAECFENYVE